ncbi:MAG TPA: NAD(P)-binding protein [Caulobacteraceae bacterium]|jgi:2-polyprenyl-6-methoxyphenol hydroxylase-like FAD-dependent oxidoreductase|nr:NAD(P)-binding protein [Caulobacteraceae bacterium]
MDEPVLVIGAGMAGLCTALALGSTGRQLTILERDAEPPSGDADTAFRDWNRRGVGHLRQSHAFLARLGKIIGADHPALREQLLEMGVRELGFESMLSPAQKQGYVAKPADAEFTLLTSRRTTLELVMRRYVETLPGVTIRSGAMVRKLLTERDPSGALKVTGVRVDEAGVETELHAAIVIDAGGKNSSGIEQLVEEGAAIPEETETAGILYFTRHYKLLPGRSEPPREGNPPSGGDLGYLKFGVFPGDNNCFSVTMCTPEIEYELRKAIVRPEMWDRLIDQLPGLKVWCNAEQATPTSQVYGMGDLKSRWRDLAADGKPAVLGFFAVGDSLARTNPLYGRGCSMAAVQASLIREVLAAETDPAARLLAYHTRVQAELRPYYLAMRSQDRGAIKRAEQALTPGYKRTLREKLLASFIADGVTPAIRFDVDLLRASMRGFHMLEHPDAWLRRPANFAKILGYWARGKKRNKAAYPPKAGPNRETLLRALGLPHEADIVILAQQREALQREAKAKEKLAA